MNLNRLMARVYLPMVLDDLGQADWRAHLLDTQATMHPEDLAHPRGQVALEIIEILADAQERIVALQPRIKDAKGEPWPSSGTSSPS